MYHDLKGSKVVIKQRASLMERQITILEQGKYEEFKIICDDIEGKGESRARSGIQGLGIGPGRGLIRICRSSVVPYQSCLLYTSPSPRDRG